MRAIRLAHEAEFALVVFTGGEATLQRHILLKGIELASRLGMRTRLVTNGWWARNESAAASFIRVLRGAGLDEINFSTGDEHAKFVPLGLIAHGLRAAILEGYEPHLMVEVHFETRLSKNVILASEEFSEIRNLIGPDNISESPWTPTSYSEQVPYPPAVLINRDTLSSRRGCESIFSTHTLQPDGRLSVCCGLGIRDAESLQLGLLRDDVTSFLPMASVAELDLTKLLIKQLGPERTLARLSELDESIDWENMYAHKCQACLRVLSDPIVQQTIERHHGQLLMELLSSIAVERVVAVELNTIEERRSARSALDKPVTCVPAQ